MMMVSLVQNFTLHHSGSRRFGEVEPHQTHSNLTCRPASPFRHTQVREGWTDKEPFRERGSEEALENLVARSHEASRSSFLR